jgi:hypothetical protein
MKHVYYIKCGSDEYNLLSHWMRASAVPEASLDVIVTRKSLPRIESQPGHLMA